MLEAAVGPAEHVATLAIGMLGRRGQLVAATEDRLLLLWKGRLTRRERINEFSWGTLTAVDAHALAITFHFNRPVKLTGITPARGYDALLAMAHARLQRDAADPSDLRELAERKLGGRLAVLGWDNELRMLPNLIQAGETVQRLAIATAGFEGLLALTDRRLVLLRGALRAGNEQVLEVARADVRRVTQTDTGLRLELAHGEVELEGVTPPARRDELFAVLAGPAD